MAVAPPPRARAAGLGLLLAAWLPLALAQGVLPVPALTARVIDQTGTLDAAQRKASKPSSPPSSSARARRSWC
jgi:uncharacterized protein